MRSLWFVLALLGLTLAGALVWSLVGHESSRTVAPRADASRGTAEGGSSDLDARRPAPVEATRAEVGPEGAGGDATALEESVAAEEATLVVLARATESRAPLAGITVELEARATGPTTAEEPSTRSGTTRITDAGGRAEFLVPAGRSLLVQARDDHGRFTPASLLVESPAVGERREVVLALTARAQRRFVARVVDDTSGSPLVFDISSSGSGLGTQVVEAVEILANQVPIEVRPDRRTALAIRQRPIDSRISARIAPTAQRVISNALQSICGKVCAGSTTEISGMWAFAMVDPVSPWLTCTSIETVGSLGVVRRAMASGIGSDHEGSKGAASGMTRQPARAMLQITARTRAGRLRSASAIHAAVVSSRSPLIDPRTKRSITSISDPPSVPRRSSARFA